MYCFPEKQQKRGEKPHMEKEEIKILNPGSNNYLVLPIADWWITSIFKETLCFKSKHMF